MDFSPVFSFFIQNRDFQDVVHGLPEPDSPGGQGRWWLKPQNYESRISGGWILKSLRLEQAPKDSYMHSSMRNRHLEVLIFQVKVICEWQSAIQVSGHHYLRKLKVGVRRGVGFSSLFPNKSSLLLHLGMDLIVP